MNTQPQSEQYSRVVEFETPLTPAECCARLNKLPKKMSYLKAKGRLELANANFAGDLRAEMVAQDRCQFIIEANVPDDPYQYSKWKLITTHSGFIQSTGAGTHVELRAHVNTNSSLTKFFTPKLTISLIVILWIIAAVVFPQNQPGAICVAGAVTLFAFLNALSRNDYNSLTELLRIVLSEAEEDNL
ncbi:MAG: hypothetical protein R3E39_12455 [Anaerolineae bacterium]